MGTSWWASASSVRTLQPTSGKAGSPSCILLQHKKIKVETAHTPQCVVLEISTSLPAKECSALMPTPFWDPAGNHYSDIIIPHSIIFGYLKFHSSKTGNLLEIISVWKTTND